MPTLDEIMPHRRDEDPDDTVAVLKIVLSAQQTQTKMLVDGMHDVKAEIRIVGDKLVGLLKWLGLGAFLLMAFLIAGILLVRGEDPRIAAEAASNVGKPLTSPDGE